ncbi:hypothetical protein HBHAL_2234 [Halobacillus halophilus DSM 2266]|uniref:Uncharacterized protein n=1 Tax=Halobacillus halophilus (strain ATCC 35676 / DSM 2266 / JCM 20832 / KCTC 3685 / LMG 17431 / NBRC 102448 / NCIMB 2269) TaxID=866895 RepID=I0JKB8_HALH3|nr:hypothetical protein HBHAL_2234 [Halobacillus halophilus DSM 2266]
MSRVVAFVANVTVAISFFLDNITALGALFLGQITEEFNYAHHVTSPPINLV